MHVIRHAFSLSMMTSSGRHIFWSIENDVGLQMKFLFFLSFVIVVGSLSCAIPHCILFNCDSLGWMICARFGWVAYLGISFTSMSFDKSQVIWQSILQIEGLVNLLFYTYFCFWDVQSTLMNLFHHYFLSCYPWAMKRLFSKSIHGMFARVFFALSSYRQCFIKFELMQFFCQYPMIGWNHVHLIQTGRRTIDNKHFSLFSTIQNT